MLPCHRLVPSAFPRIFPSIFPRALALVACLVGAAAAQAAPQAYGFIALAPPRLLSRDQPPSPPVLNASRNAASSVSLAHGREAVVAASATGRPVVLATDRQFRRFGNLSINPSGQVAFEGSPQRPDGEGIFRSDAGVLVQIAGTRDTGDFDFVNAGPSINAKGRVAFIGERIVAGNYLDGVWIGSGGPVKAAFDAHGAFDNFIGNPSLNDRGQVAFLATLDSGVGGLFLGKGGDAFVTVADETGRLTGVYGFGDPSLNERGEVAFHAGTNDDPDDNSAWTGEGVFLYSGGVLRPVVERHPGEDFSLGDPSLNNVGQVAFLVEPVFGQQVLVTGADFGNDRVVGSGDVLQGRTVSGLSFSREGLNDHGELAFTAFFTDGTAAPFVAVPVGR